MKMKTLYIIASIIFISLCSKIEAQQLSYQPINPAFGGNYLNYSWLLQSAEVQNPFKQTADYGYNNSPISTFSDSVKRQVLNQLTRGLFGGETGSGSGSGLESGTYDVGGLIITIDDTRSGSIITIIDTDTGESTQIII